jgi:hypothetical protein
LKFVCYPESEILSILPSSQTITADKERQYYLDMENLLRTQKTKASIAHERILTSNQELSRENERLQHLVSQLRVTSRGYARSTGPLLDEGTQNTVANSEDGETGTFSSGKGLLTVDEDTISISSVGFRSLQDEAKALEVEALQAELSALQKSHDMLNDQMHQIQTELSQTKAMRAELQEQNETYMDILQEKTFSGALIEESEVLNRRYLRSDTEESGTDADDVDDVPDEPKRQHRSKRRELKPKRSEAKLDNLPTSLASELETVDDDDDHDDGGDDDEEEVSQDVRKRERRRERSEMLSDNIEELHKEIWILRDANQALTLYVTKILDRIISKEGYENVLAIDGDEKGKTNTMRGTPSRLRNKRSEASLIEHQTPVVKSSKRTSSGGLLSLLGGGGLEAKEDVSQATPTPATSTSFATKARRTASIDWRSLLGGSPTLQQEPFDPLSKGLSDMGEVEESLTNEPRKIRSSEEVEDFHDKKEKEKIRQAMISHGISVPEHQLKSQRKPSGFGTFFTRVIGASNSAESSSSKKEDAVPVAEPSDQDSSTQVAAAVSDTSLHPGSSAGPENTGSGSPKSRTEARQRALDVGNPGGHLTEVPTRISPISSRRTNMKRRDTSSTSVGDSSRGESIAGDESYVLDSPVLGSEKGLVKEEDRESGWGKAFKKMSILGAAQK